MVPEEVEAVLRRLMEGGFEAWCVGGCVRDLLLGVQPADWDVTTSARPEQVEALFPGQTHPTGLAHGTVTVCSGAYAVEVTTYRLDGAYRDGRHPEQVTFTASLKEDLSRRDFTVNAMAMGLDGTVVDLYGGREDLKAGLLRCVGNPERRFSEDALRMLRALRFAAVMGFSVEAETAKATHQCKELLRAVSAERIQAELTRLICGRNMGTVLRDYVDVLAVFLPEVAPMVGFDQRNPHHCFDLWEHTIRAMEAAPPDPVLRYALLLHDIGKVDCFTMDNNGVGHFRGHPRRSGEMGEEILRRLRIDNRHRQQILQMVEWHDRPIPPTSRGVCRALSHLGEEGLNMLLQVKRADNLAQADQGRQKEIDAVERVWKALAEEGRCLTLRQLSVNGRDIAELGYRGPEIGRELRRLLELSASGAVINTRSALMAEAEKEAHRLQEHKN